MKDKDLKNKILAVIVNYGDEQIEYLNRMIFEFKNFVKYDVTVIVNSNIHIDNELIDKLNVLELEDYQLLPLTCKKEIWENRNLFDYFIFSENDHLFLEKHIDKFIEYTQILPKNRIAGLIQYEEDNTGKYYPGYHHDFDWDFDSIEVYDVKVFAHFNNLHQASFIINKEQLFRCNKIHDFTKLVHDLDGKITLFIKKIIKKLFKKDFIKKNKYSVKCKVNTDVYQFCNMKKLICISEFNDNLIHHMPNLYIKGEKGRNKFRSDSTRMENSINKILKNKKSF